MIHSYRGGCQCGAVLYEVELDLATPSAGTKSVWQRVARPSAFTLLTAEEQLSGYQYGDSAVHHFFCARCGEHAYSRHGAAHGLFYTVDVRALNGRGRKRVSAAQLAP